MRIEPRGAMADAYLEGYAELGVDGLHRAADQLGHLGELVGGDVEVQFVMHLQDHTALETPLTDSGIEADHRDLDEVSS